MAHLNWYFDYMKVFRWRMLLSWSFFVATGVIIIGNTSIQKWIIDDVFLEGRYSILPILLGLLAIGAVIANALHAVSELMMAMYNMRLQQKLTNDYKRSLNRMPVGKFQLERTGEYVHTFLHEIPSVARYGSHYIPGLIRQAVQAIVLASIIAWANWALFAVLTLFSLIYIAIGKKSMPQLKKITQEKQQLHTLYTTNLEEGIVSTREIIAFHQQKWEQRRLNEIFRDYFQKVMEEIRWKNFQMYITEPVQWFPSLAVLGFGGYLVTSGTLSLGLFVVVFQFSRQYMNSVNQSYHQLIGISQQHVMIERVYGKFHSEMIEEGIVRELEPVQSMRLEQVSYRYEPHLADVVRELSLEFPVGRKIAIVGASGSGKSTIAKLLMKQCEPTIGTIRVNGYSLTNIHNVSWYDRISYVSQEPYLLPDSIRENVRYGRYEFSDSYIEKVCDIAQIASWIELLPDGYDTLCGERGIQLSGGERQRIAIARALLGNKDVLILDEATSALDQETERILQDRLDEVRQGKTTVIIAHRLSTILNADLIAVMDRGTLIDVGTHEELMKRCSVYIELNTAVQQDVLQIGTGS
ncbi:ABC transporter ATP-binding protein [Paenibacillus glucanolyticus]|uniref:ABC transporter ATP-binding protein n=1 Tax=Paenibacillus glucanolyticus TaxID=59843 RepID=UPI0036971A0F